MSYLVCWQHFLISDFKKEITEDDIARCNFGQLKKDVVPSQHLPGDPEISLEDTKFALFVTENDQNIDKNEKSVNIEEDSENVRDSIVHTEVVDSELNIASETNKSVENCDKVSFVSEDHSQNRVLRTYLVYNSLK